MCVYRAQGTLVTDSAAKVSGGPLWWGRGGGDFECQAQQFELDALGVPGVQCPAH